MMQSLHQAVTHQEQQHVQRHPQNLSSHNSIPRHHRVHHLINPLGLRPQHHRSTSIMEDQPLTLIDYIAAIAIGIALGLLVAFGL
jgi:hypothetical protein